MKIVYYADDGRKFATEEACIEYERVNNLHAFINDSITRTYCDDAGFGVIEVQDVVEFLEKYFYDNDFTRLVHSHIENTCYEKS